MEGADDSTELWCPPYLSFRPLGLEAATSRPTVPKLQQVSENQFTSKF